MASYLFPLWVALGLLIPAFLGGVIVQSWAGVWTGLIWGGLVRLFLVHHVTWSVNSACHLWGFRPYQTDDESRDNIIFGVLAMGEGWHCTHHAFPTSARHGLRWWQIDVSYWVIRTMALLGLAWNVKVPGKQAQAGRRSGSNEPQVGEHSGVRRIMTQELLKNAPGQGADGRESVVPEREPGNRPKGEPGNRPNGEPGNELLPPDAERRPARREGVVSDPDSRGPGDEAVTTGSGVPAERRRCC